MRNFGAILPAQLAPSGIFAGTHPTPKLVKVSPNSSAEFEEHLGQELKSPHGISGSKQAGGLIKPDKKGAFRLPKSLTLKMVGRDGFEPT